MFSRIEIVHRDENVSTASTNSMRLDDPRFYSNRNVLITSSQYKQGNQRWQIPRPPHASAWQRSPH